MARKDSLFSMRQILIKRRDALRNALAGDLSLLKELRAQAAGDVVDAALDSAQDEISSQLAEVESRELARIENALERMRDRPIWRCAKVAGSKSRWRGSMPCRMQPIASNASANPNGPAAPARTNPIGAGWSTAATSRTFRSTISKSTSEAFEAWLVSI